MHLGVFKIHTKSKQQSVLLDQWTQAAFGTTILWWEAFLLRDVSRHEMGQQTSQPRRSSRGPCTVFCNEIWPRYAELMNLGAPSKTAWHLACGSC